MHPDLIFSRVYIASPQILFLTPHSETRRLRTSDHWITTDRSLISPDYYHYQTCSIAHYYTYDTYRLQRLTVYSAERIYAWMSVNRLTLSVLHFSDCGKMSLPNRSGPYWSNPPFFNFWHSGSLALSPERQRARMSKIFKNGGLDQYGAGYFEV